MSREADRHYHMTWYVSLPTATSPKAGKPSPAKPQSSAPHSIFHAHVPGASTPQMDVKLRIVSQLKSGQVLTERLTARKT